MKVIFANPPVFRYKNRSPRGDKRVKVDLALKKIIPSVYFSKLLASTGIWKGFRYGVRAGSRWPWSMSSPHGGPPFPFMMGYSAALLHKNGYDIDIVDAVVLNIFSYTFFLNIVRHKNPDLVVLECSTPTIDIDLWMAEEIASFSEVALAGPHLFSKLDDVRATTPFVKFYLPGEYICSSLAMVASGVAGVYQSNIVEDLDSIPNPYRSFEGGANYFDPTMPTKKPQLQIYGSKGCPFRCTFCLWPQTMYQGRVALRQSESIAIEIREAVALHGYQSIFFDDDTFNVGTDRVSKICDELKEIGLPWTMMGRLDCSPMWLYEKMVDCGCVGMRFGVETFNLDVLSKVNKGIERTDFKSTLEKISNNYPNVMIHLTMMKDLPGQSDQDHEMDMKIIHDMGYSLTSKLRNFQLSVCSPFPGTKMYDDLKNDFSAQLDDLSSYDGGQSQTVMKNIK